MFSRSRLILAATIVLIAMSVLVVLKLQGRLDPAPLADSSAVNIEADLLPALAGAGSWINAGAQPLDSLHGHTLVVALWSDTDRRCLDALPAVESWHQSYARYGVRVIGVYSPDFSFGVDSLVPLRVARRLALTFPIALDPSYTVRSRLGPVAGAHGIVVATGDGRIVEATDFEHLDRVDRAVRDQLRRLEPALDFPADPEPVAGGPSRQIRLVHLGAGRADSGPLVDVAAGRSQYFTTQFRYQEEGKDYVPFPVGRWTPTSEGVTADRGGASEFVAIRNPGDRVDAVLSPTAVGVSRVWVLADEGWLAEGERGADIRVDARGASFVEVTEPRLYEIARPGASHVLRLSPDQPGLTIHAFAFERITP